MQHVIDLAARALEEIDRLRALSSDLSAAYGTASEEDWPGDDQLLDRAERKLSEATGPIFAALDLLQQHLGSAEFERSGLGVP